MGFFLRLLALALVVLTVIFVCLMFYLRAARREKLEEKWHQDGIGGDKEGWIAAALQKDEPAVLRKLAIGVYGVPLALMTAIVIATEWS